MKSIAKKSFIEVQGFLEHKEVIEIIKDNFTEEGPEYHKLDGYKFTEIQLFGIIRDQEAMKVLISYLEVAQCCLPK